MSSFSKLKDDMYMDHSTLPEITCILRPLESKYFDLGVQLGVGYDRIKQIEKDYQDSSRRFAETIVYWLNSGNPTRSALADAVERVGGYDNLVRKLRACADTLPGFTAAAASIQTQCSSSEECDTGYSSTSRLNSASGDSSHGSEMQYFDEVPGCGCPPDRKPCSFRTLSTIGCPTPACTIGLIRKRVHGPSIRDGLCPNDAKAEEETDYAEAYEEATRQIRTKFARFSTRTCISFGKREIKPLRLKLFLQNDLPASKSKLNGVKEGTPLEQVFIVVSDHCSWLEYEPIKNLIEEFGNDEDEARFKKYENDLGKFVERRLPKEMKHIKVGDGPGSGSKQLVVKFDKEWSKTNFNDISGIRGRLASILGVHRRELYLADVREGCIMMTFMISQELAESLFPRRDHALTASQICSLEGEGVISLKCKKFRWRSAPTSYSSSQSRSLKGKGIVTLLKCGKFGRPPVPVMLSKSASQKWLLRAKYTLSLLKYENISWPHIPIILFSNSASQNRSLEGEGSLKCRWRSCSLFTSSFMSQRQIAKWCGSEAHSTMSCSQPLFSRPTLPQFSDDVFFSLESRFSQPTLPHGQFPELVFMHTLYYADKLYDKLRCRWSDVMPCSGYTLRLAISSTGDIIEIHRYRYTVSVVSVGGEQYRYKQKRRKKLNQSTVKNEKKRKRIFSYWEKLPGDKPRIMVDIDALGTLSSELTILLTLNSESSMQPRFSSTKKQYSGHMHLSGLH